MKRTPLLDFVEQIDRKISMNIKNKKKKKKNVNKIMQMIEHLV
jgi:hypothetical protein